MVDGIRHNKIQLSQRDHTVSRLTTLDESDLSEESLEALAAVRMNNKLAPIYLQFANSQPALNAYLHMEASIRSGSLALIEVEAVKLWLSQQTGCDFCLSVHSFKGKQAGLEPDVQRAIRRGEPTGTERLDCILEIAAVLFRQRGKLPDELLAKARSLELTDENLVDLTMVMSTIFFTNITNHINDSQSALPPAVSIDE